jgi:hypothetical protein
MKNAQGFPDPGVKGEPGILGAIHRRQSINPGNASVVHLPTGTAVSIPQRKQAPGGAKPGPFEPVLSGNFTDGWEVTVTTGEIRSFEDVTPLASIDNIATSLDGVSAGDVVYLKFLNGISIYYASVHVGTVGDDGEGWEDYPARGKFSTSPPYDMTESYLELARVENTDPEDLESPLRLAGIWKSGHIVTQQAFVYGKLGAFAFPGN